MKRTLLMTKLFLVFAFFSSGPAYASLVINMGSCAGLTYFVLSTYGINGASPITLGAALDYDGDGEIASSSNDEGQETLRLYGVQRLDGTFRSVTSQDDFKVLFPLADETNPSSEPRAGLGRFMEVITPAAPNTPSTYVIFEATHPLAPNRADIESGTCLTFDEVEEIRFNSLTPEEQRRETAIQETNALNIRISNAIIRSDWRIRDLDDQIGRLDAYQSRIDAYQSRIENVREQINAALELADSASREK